MKNLFIILGRDEVVAILRKSYEALPICGEVRFFFIGEKNEQTI